MGKNIAVFSDGTGQEGDVGNNTNVNDPVLSRLSPLKRLRWHFLNALPTLPCGQPSRLGLWIARQVRD